jgi:hypothetical protein
MPRSELGSLSRVVLLASLAAWGCSGSPPRTDSSSGLDAGRDAGVYTLDNVDIVLESEEVVFDHSANACNDLDVPDTPAHAVRIDGGVLLASSDAPEAYFSFGPTLETAVRDCAPVLVSPQATLPEQYEHFMWPHSVYRESGVIYALVHDEYHDPFARNCKPGDLSPANPCWWNSITLASSIDDGHTFTWASPPANLVAAPHLRWDPDAGPNGHPVPSGYMSPSNIVKGPDGAYYALIRSVPDPADGTKDGTCVMRTPDLAQPASWRSWDGNGFNSVFVDPYSVDAGTVIAACAQVSRNQIGSMHESLTYSTFFQAWLLVSATVRTGEVLLPDGGPSGPGPICGFYASLSQDLVHWSEAKLLRQVPLGFPPCAEDQYAYPSLIDPADTSTNYERSGPSPYLYFMHNSGGLDRQLRRQRIDFRPR